MQKRLDLIQVRYELLSLRNKQHYHRQPLATTNGQLNSAADHRCVERFRAAVHQQQHYHRQPLATTNGQLNSAAGSQCVEQFRDGSVTTVTPPPAATCNGEYATEVGCCSPRCRTISNGSVTTVSQPPVILSESDTSDSLASSSWSWNVTDFCER